MQESIYVMSADIVYGLENLTERPAGCVVTIGNFDGVHRGHQGILGLARRLADGLGRLVLAVTFEPPPARLLLPQQAPEPLMQLDQRCRTLLAARADCVLVLQTTAELLGMSPEAFVRDILVARLGPAHVVEGRNFFFGHARAGNVETLAKFGEQLGFEVHLAESVTVDLNDRRAVTICSSLIRRLIREGRVEEAAKCLGRPYIMQGTVVAGRGLGRRIGYPTANLDCGVQLLPADGVYAGWAELGAETYRAALSVGSRPTFDQTDRIVEAYLLSQAGQLYGRTMAVRFANRLRGQQKFQSARQLVQQMEKDVACVREILE